MNIMSLKQMASLSRMTGTHGFAEMELSDFDIREEDFKGADYSLGIAQAPRSC